MYDNLKIKTAMLPLSESEKESIGENVEWQTKDFECILSTAEITDDGKLRFQTFTIYWDKNQKSGLFQLTGKMGALCEKDHKWVDLPEYHGFVNFYSTENGIWYEFNAKFTDGQLVEIKRVADNIA